MRGTTSTPKVPKRPDPRPTAGSRWRSRPYLAMVLRALPVLLPTAAGVATAVLLGHLLPIPEDGGRVVWLGVLFASSSVVALLVDRLARRLLPLAVLLRLSLIFPDEAPSRGNPNGGGNGGGNGGRPAAATAGATAVATGVATAAGPPALATEGRPAV